MRPRFLTRPLAHALDRRFAEVNERLDTLGAREDEELRLQMVGVAAHGIYQGIATIQSAPAMMSLAERAALYACVVNLRPWRCLEVGSRHGGSAIVIVAALDTVGHGRLVCLDPRPEIEGDVWKQIGHRSLLVPKASPEGIPEAVESAGGHFDFALLDAWHDYEHASADLAGLWEAMRPGSLVLLHDVFVEGVRQAIEEKVEQYGITDRGLVAESHGNAANEAGEELFGGLRLLQFGSI